MRGLLDPNLIFYPPYLVSGGAVLLAWAMRRERLSWRAAWRALAAREIWLTRSSLNDFLFSLIYVVLIRAPLAAAEGWAFLATLTGVGGALARLAPGRLTYAAPLAVEAGIATAATMLAIDVAAYATHRAMHAVPWLWRVHALHHGATALTPLTTYRQHPLEPFLLGVARAAAAGAALAAVHRVFWRETPVATVAGLGAGFFVYMFTVNLHHAPLAVRYPRWLSAVLVSPHAHHLHHSAAPRHRDVNFGVVFSFWDRWFGTYCDEVFARGALVYGLIEDEKTTAPRAVERAAPAAS